LKLALKGARKTRYKNSKDKNIIIDKTDKNIKLPKITI
tara:strand:+ start:992 stop:1105 length:114 start_codon:yes stop_codon:yes gene_type:complete